MVAILVWSLEQDLIIDSLYTNKSLAKYSFCHAPYVWFFMLNVCFLFMCGHIWDIKYGLKSKVNHDNLKIENSVLCGPLKFVLISYTIYHVFTYTNAKAFQVSF